MPAATASDQPTNAFTELALKASTPLHNAMLTMTRLGARDMPVSAALQAVMLGAMLSTATLAAALEPEEGDEPDSVLKMLHDQLDQSFAEAHRLNAAGQA